MTEIQALKAEIKSLRSERTAWRVTAENAEKQLEDLKASKPVAWDVYVEESDNGYLVDSLEDPQQLTT